MPKGYSKIDTAEFRRKLKNGEYKDLTGAKRAIGKMQGWSEKERTLARSAAAKHFGDSAPAPTKVSKKKASKKTTKKAAKKSGPGPGRGRKKKKAAKRGKAAPKAAPAKGAKPAKAQPGPKKAAKGAPPGEMESRIENTRNAVQAYAEAVDVLRKCQGEGHSINDGLAKAAAGVTRLIEDMDRSIVQPLAGGPPSAAEQKGAELFRRAAPAAVTPENGGQPHPVAAPPPIPAPPTQTGVVPPTYNPPQV